jgi:hypothetical protein
MSIIPIITCNNIIQFFIGKRGGSALWGCCIRQEENLPLFENLPDWLHTNDRSSTIFLSEGGKPMNHSSRLIPCICWLLTLLLLSACILSGGSTPAPTANLLTAAQVIENYPAYEGQMVGLRGYGVIMETLPLCPGYQGLDTRLLFVDEENDSITAIVAVSTSGTERSEDLRDFQAYVRVFSGEIGCPGSLQSLTFPYLEIVAVK